MCFGDENRKFCHIYDGKHFNISVKSKCDHFYTDGLAIYKGSPFTTGSNVPGCYKTTERIMNAHFLKETMAQLFFVFFGSFFAGEYGATN